MNRRQRRIAHRTAQLPLLSRTLYKIEHYTALRAVALVASAVVIGCVLTITLLRFAGKAVAAFEISVSALTLIMAPFSTPRGGSRQPPNASWTS